MKNYIAIFVAILFFGSTGIVFAAPVFNLFGNVAPSQNQVFDLGTTTPALEWKNVYTKNLFVSGTCTGCSATSFGQDWQLTTNTFSQSALTPTTTQNIHVSGTGTSTFVGGLEAWRQISAPKFNATSTSATSTFAGDIALSSGGYIFGDTINSHLQLSNSAGTHLGYGSGASHTNFTLTGGIFQWNVESAGELARLNTTGFGIATTAPGSILSIGTAPNEVANFRIGTSTLYDNLYVGGNIQAGGAIIADVNLVSSGDATINGKLTVTGALDFDSFTSALLLTGAGGDVAEYAGTSCTNQFIRSVNGAGVATCASVSLSADVTGDLPFANITQLSANSVWANNTSATADGASVSTSTLYGVGNYGDLLMYNSGLKLTATSSLFVFSPAFSTTNSIKNVVERSFTYSTSTAWTGTTTIPLLQATIASTYSGFRCKTYITGNAPGGTLNIQLGKYSASTTMATASSTNNYNAFSSNNTVAAGDSWYVDIGTPASSPMKINCTYQILI